MARLTRVEFGAALKALETGEPHAYFQPPTGKSIEYPCFIYSRITGLTMRADNNRYGYAEGYEVLYITTDPDTDMPSKIMDAFTYCSDGKPYVKDNLYHFPFTIYNK